MLQVGLPVSYPHLCTSMLKPAETRNNYHILQQFDKTLIKELSHTNTVHQTLSVSTYYTKFSSLLPKNNTGTYQFNIKIPLA